MSEEDTANQIPDGGGQDDTANQIAQGSAEPAANQKPDGSGQDKDVEGLKAAMIAEQKRRQEAEEQLRQFQMRQQLAEQTQSQQRDPNDLITYADMQQQQAKLIQSMQLQNFRIQHSDMDAVIGRNAGTLNYSPSEQVTKMIQSNPALAGIEQFIAVGNPQAIAVAYEHCKAAQELEDLRKFKQAAEEQARAGQMVNQSDVTSPVSLGGGGGANLASQVPDMSSDKFDEFYERVKSGEFNTQGV